MTTRGRPDRRPADAPTTRSRADVVTCRCNVLNVMTGDAAEDYARQHLDETRSDGQGRVYYRCSESGVGWVKEQPRGPMSGEAIQLRRTDRA